MSTQWNLIGTCILHVVFRFHVRYRMLLSEEKKRAAPCTRLLIWLIIALLLFVWPSPWVEITVLRYRRNNNLAFCRLPQFLPEVYLHVTVNVLYASDVAMMQVILQCMHSWPTWMYSEISYFRGVKFSWLVKYRHIRGYLISWLTSYSWYCSSVSFVHGGIPLLQV